MNHIILEALNIVRYGKRVKQVEFVTELAEVLPTLELVPDQVLQVFINILINAVDALEDQKGIIKVFSRVNHLKLDILISDNGRGIPQEDLDKVFEPFFTTKEIGKGTGLGLWVSYGIMKNF